VVWDECSKGGERVGGRVLGEEISEKENTGLFVLGGSWKNSKWATAQICIRWKDIKYRH